jgi:hypothetical protein
MYQNLFNFTTGKTKYYYLEVWGDVKFPIKCITNEFLGEIYRIQILQIKQQQ